MPLVRLAATAWIRAPGQLRAVSELVGSPVRVLGGMAGPSVAPELTGRLPMPPHLAALLGSLRGRVVVTNPCATGRLPRDVGTLARIALRERLAPSALAERRDGAGPWRSPDRSTVGDTRAAAEARRLRALLDALSGPARAALDGEDPATWVAAALYEPTTLAVRLADAARAPAAPSPSPALATARYRLVLVVGAGEPPATWDDIDLATQRLAATPWPVGAAEGLPWFAVRVLVSDAIAAHDMDPSTLARWAAITGRAGPTSRDHYWFAESWDRFREPNRRVGHVTPAEIARSRRHGRSVADRPWVMDPTLTPHAERGVCAPPGYCLVDCLGTLELSAVRA